MAEKARATDETAFVKANVEWTLTDGTSLKDANATRATSVMAPLNELKTSLETAYDTYSRNKNIYQVKLPAQLLELEVALRNVQASASINNGESALLVY